MLNYYIDRAAQEKIVKEAGLGGMALGAGALYGAYRLARSPATHELVKGFAESAKGKEVIKGLYDTAMGIKGVPEAAQKIRGYVGGTAFGQHPDVQKAWEGVKKYHGEYLAGRGTPGPTAGAGVVDNVPMTAANKAPAATPKQAPVVNNVPVPPTSTPAAESLYFPTKSSWHNQPIITTTPTSKIPAYQPVVMPPKQAPLQTPAPTGIPGSFKDANPVYKPIKRDDDLPKIGPEISGKKPEISIPEFKHDDYGDETLHNPFPEKPVKARSPLSRKFHSIFGLE